MNKVLLHQNGEKSKNLKRNAKLTFEFLNFPKEKNISSLQIQSPIDKIFCYFVVLILSFSLKKKECKAYEY